MNERSILAFFFVAVLPGCGAALAGAAEPIPAASAAVAAEDVRLIGPCTFYDGRQGGGGAHFADGALVLTADTLRIHPGGADAPATVVLRFAEMNGAALRRYAGARQVQIRTAAGVIVIEMSGRPGQPDTDALMAELRAHHVPFWDSGRFYRRG